MVWNGLAFTISIKKINEYVIWSIFCYGFCHRIIIIANSNEEKNILNHIKVINGAIYTWNRIDKIFVFFHTFCCSSFIYLFFCSFSWLMVYYLIFMNVFNAHIYSCICSDVKDGHGVRESKIYIYQNDVDATNEV